ncbi:putative EF hand [Trichinella nativa]|uniref:Putative EF hand n=1 Tax=Trichinella nativa TaxID=6335 RepID=A0A1Y3ERN1_9BILA|nr:putative EF hand [Trichinella nativa]
MEQYTVYLMFVWLSWCWLASETEMMENSDEKEAETAFVLIKGSLSCDLKTVDELLQALQVAGCSPSIDDLPKSEECPFSFLTFCEIFKMIKPVKEDTLRDAFRCFDKSNCGTISICKLNALMIENNSQLMDFEIDALNSKVDSDDGEQSIEYNKLIICYEEAINELKQLSLANYKMLKKNETKSSPNDDGNNGDANNTMNCVERRGFFVLDHIENQTIISSHQYRITNVELQNITIEIQHLAGAFDTKPMQTVDVWIIIYDEDDRYSTDCSDYARIKFRNDLLAKHFQGKSIIHQQLPAGRYIIVPFTTQCLFKPRKTIESEKNKVSLLKVDRAGKPCLTKEMKLALMNIFDLCDLDNNGTLTREEFNLYNIRTGDETVSDEEWNVIQEHFELKNEELTLRDFLELHEMEAEDCKSDTTDMWLSLESMGCNYKLELDEIVAFGIPKQLGHPIKVVAESVPSEKA